MAFPLDSLRRPPLRRLLEGLGAGWRPVDGSAVAERLSSEADPRELALVDLSALPRIGFKGRGTVEAMRRRGVALDPVANRAFRQGDGSLCLVLAPSEVILLSSLAGDGATYAAWERDFRLEDEERTYPMPRRDSHFWLALAGRRVPEMLAKVSGIDFRLSKFAALAIAQTSVAKMSAIVVRCDFGRVPLFYLLADSASAAYFAASLKDAAREFAGDFVGFERLEEIAAHEPTTGRRDQEGHPG
jgi:sarcosine oxidase subunit gamma